MAVFLFRSAVLQYLRAFSGIFTALWTASRWWGNHVSRSTLSSSFTTLARLSDMHAGTVLDFRFEAGFYWLPLYYQLNGTWSFIAIMLLFIYMLLYTFDVVFWYLHTALILTYLFDKVEWLNCRLPEPY